MSPAEDSMRRDAIARSLCARICDERKSEADLELLDTVLCLIEKEVSAPMRARIIGDRYNENEGDEVQRAYKRGWNHGSRHADAIAHVELALREVTEAPALDLRVKRALTGEG